MDFVFCTWIGRFKHAMVGLPNFVCELTYTQSLSSCSVWAGIASSLEEQVFMENNIPLLDFCSVIFF